MLRTNRVTAALVRQLLLRSLPTVALAATVSIAAVGCEDESKPEYSVKRLEDVTTAPRAIQKLFNFYTDGETKAEGKAPESDDVKSFLALKEMSIEALTNCYVNLFNDLNEADRVKLINLISIARDPRTEPALKKALEEFAKDGTRSDDLKFAMRAASELKLAGVASAVVPAFKKIRASSPQGGSVYRDMNDTMLKWADKSWGPQLVSVLSAEIVVPTDAKDKDKISSYKDQIFWQTAASQVLGEIGEKSAIVPLLKVVVDPAKAPIHTTALYALSKLGKDAMLEASKLIEDESGELAKFASERATIAKLDATEWRLNQAIIATAAGGRGDAVDLLIKIATTNAKESARAMAAAQLPNLPVSAKSIEAYKSVFEKLGDEAKLVNGASAKNVVANAAPDFFDATLVPWLVQQTNKAKDEQLKTILVIAAAKLMSAADIASVKAIAEKSGGEFGKKVFDAMSEVVSSCGDKVDCYLAEMQKGSNQAGDKELAAIKSAMMVGVYGSDAINDTLMSKLSNVSSAESRGISSKALLRFNPKGSVALADKIDEVVTKNAKFGDEKAKSGDQGLKDAMYRLRARAN